MRTIKEVLSDIQQSLDAQFDIYSWENMIDDTNLTPSEKEFAKKYTEPKVMFKQLPGQEVITITAIDKQELHKFFHNKAWDDYLLNDAMRDIEQIDDAFPPDDAGN